MPTWLYSTGCCRHDLHFEVVSVSIMFATLEAPQLLVSEAPLVSMQCSRQQKYEGSVVELVSAFYEPASLPLHAIV